MKYKLNMLEPGSHMCKGIGVLVAMASMMFLLNRRRLGIVFLIGAMLVSMVLGLLIAIELHQDKKLFIAHEKEKGRPLKLNEGYECEYCGARFQKEEGNCPICYKVLARNLPHDKDLERVD